MYKVLLGDYEQRQKQLMLENAELKKVLQQMKKEMISIISPKKARAKDKLDDSLGPVRIFSSGDYLNFRSAGDYLNFRSSMFCDGVLGLSMWRSWTTRFASPAPQLAACIDHFACTAV